MKKSALCLTALLLLASALPAIDVGVIAGPISKPANLAYGLSFGTGFPVPFMKLEFELYKISDEPAKSMSAAVKFRAKLGAFSPYAAIGAGTEFDRISLHLKDDYNGYTFLALGAHLHLAPLLSLRFDARILHFAAHSRARISGGVFLHL
jgi:hypothetical protein